MSIFHMERSEEHTSELQSPCNLVCRLLLEKKKKKKNSYYDRIYCASLCPTPVRPGSLSTCVAEVSELFVLYSLSVVCRIFFFFFFNDRAPPEFSPFPLPAALPI